MKNISEKFLEELQNPLIVCLFEKFFFPREDSPFLMSNYFPNTNIREKWTKTSRKLFLADLNLKPRNLLHAPGFWPCCAPNPNIIIAFPPYFICFFFIDNFNELCTHCLNIARQYDESVMGERDVVNMDICVLNFYNHRGRIG